MSEPKLMAEFEMGQDGRPAYVRGGSKNHYKLCLSIADAPSWATLVTYRLHSTYRNPIREVSVGIPGFKECITAYGDFEVLVTLSGNETGMLPPTWLSDALEQQYQGRKAPGILDAIEEIRRN